MVDPKKYACMLTLLKVGFIPISLSTFGVGATSDWVERTKRFKIDRKEREKSGKVKGDIPDVGQKSISVCSSPQLIIKPVEAWVAELTDN